LVPQDDVETALALEVLSARPYAYLDDAPLEERRTQAVMGRRWLAPEDAADLGRLHIPKQKALPFIVLSDHRPAPHLLDAAGLAERFKPKPAQLGFGF